MNIDLIIKAFIVVAMLICIYALIVVFVDMLRENNEKENTQELHEKHIEKIVRKIMREEIEHAQIDRILMQKSMMKKDMLNRIVKSEFNQNNTKTNECHKIMNKMIHDELKNIRIMAEKLYQDIKL